jgi:hypothetical protein
VAVILLRSQRRLLPIAMGSAVAIYKASSTESLISTTFAEKLHISESETGIDGMVIHLQWRCRDIGTGLFESSFKVTSKLDNVDVLFGADNAQSQSLSVRYNREEALKQGFKKQSSWKTSMTKPIEDINRRRKSWSVKANSRKSSVTSEQILPHSTIPAQHIAPVRQSSPDEHLRSIEVNLMATVTTPPASPRPDVSTDHTFEPREDAAFHPRPNFHNNDTLPETPTSLRNSVISWQDGSQSSKDVLGVALAEQTQFSSIPQTMQTSHVLEASRQRDEPGSLDEADGIELPDRPQNGESSPRHQFSGDSGISGMSFSDGHGNDPSDGPSQQGNPRMFVLPGATHLLTRRDLNQGSVGLQSVEEIQGPQRKAVGSIIYMGSLKEVPENEVPNVTDEDRNPRFPADYWTEDPISKRLYHDDEDGEREYFESLD